MDGIERFDSPDKGRGLRVSRSFRVGELLFSCPAYCHVLSAAHRGQRCDFCLDRKESLARCGKCKKAFYCGVKCQKGDWEAHKLECSAMVAFGDNWRPSESSRLVARILAKKKTQNGRCASEKILPVGEMQSHLADMDDEKRDATQADAAGLHRFYSKHLDFPDSKELLSLFSQVACNGFTIEDEELSHLGTAVYPDVALINHSCVPNVIVTFDGTRAQVRAVNHVEAGDEVLISYIDPLYPTDDRNGRLRDAYYFCCRCRECRTRSKDELKLKVRKRREPVAAEALSAMLRYARKTISDFRGLKLIKNILFPTHDELLEMCEQSLEKMATVLDDANVFVLHMSYQAMGVCVYRGDFRAAVRYGEKLLKPFTELYPAYSLNVASLYLKLGRLYLALDRRAEGLRRLDEALSIMEVAHGDDHPYVRDLRKLKQTSF
ncbi:N-lysine methyltransferase SMYD2-B-like [Syngnathoides biaculeatus]|uniref:N-lysine methyltransferase SMYD2-B-like n=1 Tax=Syngnathoides biaculeatus TaxID=300417 RepID=UPI002ADE3C05|nr:N-lysine methyltransferase SMYD2-B-like [Syngnathoides biaculeatus]